MKLNKDEYTFETLIAYLEENFGKKKNGEPFNRSDIAQYLIREKLPKKYGGLRIEKMREQGVTLIKMTSSGK